MNKKESLHEEALLKESLSSTTPEETPVDPIRLDKSHSLTNNISRMRAQLRATPAKLQKKAMRSIQGQYGNEFLKAVMEEDSQKLPQKKEAAAKATPKSQVDPAAGNLDPKEPLKKNTRPKTKSTVQKQEVAKAGSTAAYSGKNPLEMSREEFLASTPAQEELLRKADQANSNIAATLKQLVNEVNPLLSQPIDPEKMAFLKTRVKRRPADKLAAAVNEKMTRPDKIGKYKLVGNLSDLVSGRINTITLNDANIVKEYIISHYSGAKGGWQEYGYEGFGRFHLDLPIEGFSFELQIGALALEEYLETRKIRLPEVLKAQFKSEVTDLHDACKDLIANIIRNPKVDEALKKGWGLYDIMTRFNSGGATASQGSSLSGEQYSDLLRLVENTLHRIALENPTVLTESFKKVK